MRILVAILILLLILLQYDLWVGEGSLATVHLLNQSIEKEKLENQQLKERNAALEAEVLDLKQGLEAIEERARSEMGMVKEGETYIQVIDKRQETRDE
ncbi:MAG: cell division protein FtsB [Gammaproteobacteria bacterium]|nr:cell division protein FtsB [Gammaproteobacteria bacterium]